MFAGLIICILSAIACVMLSLRSAHSYWNSNHESLFWDIFDVGTAILFMLFMLFHLHVALLLAHEILGKLNVTLPTF